MVSVGFCWFCLVLCLLGMCKLEDNSYYAYSLNIYLDCKALPAVQCSAQCRLKPRTHRASALLAKLFSSH